MQRLSGQHMIWRLRQPKHLQDGVVVKRQPGAVALCLRRTCSDDHATVSGHRLPQAGSNQHLYSCSSTNTPTWLRHRARK
jgi:hypothetical protein